MCILEHKPTFLNVHSQHTTKTWKTSRTLRVSAAGDADGFVVNLQTDGARELTLDAFDRRCQRAWAAAGLLLLLLLRAELRARRNKAPKHRHHGAENGLQLSTNKLVEQERKLSSCFSAAVS